MTTNKKNNIKIGGNVLTSGGFGCLFRPALKCKNTLNYARSDKNLVTKLMTKKHARDEYRQINEFKSILDHIPNYQNYFLVDDFSICEPAELTSDDLDDFDDECSALKKKKFTAKNINDNLSKILALNMPDGGIDVDDYLFAIKDKDQIVPTYIDLNISLVDLLVNGINPMNQSRLYHCDIKGSNILVKRDEETQQTNTRLIDWGLSVYLKGTNKNNRNNRHIPDNLNRRPFQFNVPFSVILFNKKFTEKYGIFLKRHQTLNFFSIREFVVNYIFFWNKIRGPGHLKTINSIVKILTYGELPAVENKKVKEHVIEYEFTYYYIVEYISRILFKYTVSGRLNLLDYFNNVFLKNIDVWGLTMTYMEFIDNLQSHYQNDDSNELNESHIHFIDKIKQIIIHFLFENSTEVIDIKRLAIELQSLNKLISKFDANGRGNGINGNGINETNIDNYLNSLTKIKEKDVIEIGGGNYKKNHITTNKSKRANKRSNKKTNKGSKTRKAKH
jgi:hypothetical protein